MRRGLRIGLRRRGLRRPRFALSVADDLDDPATVAGAVELHEEDALPRAEAELPVADGDRLAGGAEEITDPERVRAINGDAAAHGPTHLFRLDLREVSTVELDDDREASMRDIRALAERYGSNPDQFDGQERVTLRMRVERVIRHD